MVDVWAGLVPLKDAQCDLKKDAGFTFHCTFVFLFSRFYSTEIIPLQSLTRAYIFSSVCLYPLLKLNKVKIKTKKILDPQKMLQKLALKLKQSKT